MARLALRRTEWVLVAYFSYVAILARLLPVKPPVPTVTLALTLMIIGGYGLLAYADSLRRRRLLGVIRDWFPTPLLILGYREMGWFAPAEHTFELERTWVVWDKFFLNSMGVKALIESLGPVLPSLLEISYSLVYAIPYFSLGLLYAYCHRERADRFLFPVRSGGAVGLRALPFFSVRAAAHGFPRRGFSGLDHDLPALQLGPAGKLWDSHQCVPERPCVRGLLGGLRHAARAAGEEVGVAASCW